jgi:flagellar protein FliS
MNPQAAQAYLRTKVLTATPEQLQLMLYDGALRYGEQAKVALRDGKWEVSFTMISRMQKIVGELSSSLRHDLYPELCGKLSALYNYAFRKLVQANVEHKIEALEEAMKILKYQRETWVLLLEQLGKQKAAAAAGRMDIPAPSAQMEASLSMRG